MTLRNSKEVLGHLTHSALVTDICVVWCCSPTGTRCLPVVARWWTTGFLNHLISPLFVCCLGVGEQQAFQKIIFTVVPSLFRCWWTTGYLETFFLLLFTRCLGVGDQRGIFKRFCSRCLSVARVLLTNKRGFSSHCLPVVWPFRGRRK